MTFEQKELYRAIDEILWKEWDPIGVNEYEEARDEYQSYTPRIFSLKINGADGEVIARELYDLETKTMGVLGSINHCRTIAFKIIGLK